MRKPIIRYILVAFVIAFSAPFSGCGSLNSTVPNQPYKGPYPQHFSAIAQKNPLLANELGKLPEMQDGITPAEASTLEKILEIYNSDPELFEKAFNEMYQEGFPEIRKYCSPLQALFWFVEDGGLSDGNNPLTDYSLEKLLYRAWNVNSSFFLSDEQIIEITENIVDERKKKLYLVKKQFNNNDTMRDLIISDYNKNRKIFSEEVQRDLEEALTSKKYKALQLKQNIRWKDYNVVTDRLNSPDLVNYYQKKDFSYKKVFLTYDPNVEPAPRTGKCTDYAWFCVYCLNKAGYRARFGIFAGFYTGDKGQAACDYEGRDGRRYILDANCLECGNGTGITLKDDYVKRLPEIGSWR